MDNERIRLEQQLEMVIGQSRDAYYTEYLQGLLVNLRRQSITTEYAAWELNRTYGLYQQRMQAYDARMQAVRPAQISQQTQPVQQMQMMRQIQTSQQANRSKRNMEFLIGAGLLSVVGALFVLISFVMLGMNYMNGILKGMSLYAIALMVLLVSELILARKMPKFAVGISGLGICGMYLSTMLNYLYLKNFGAWIAVGVSVVISMAAAFMGRKKDCGMIKIISFVGCYICLFPISRNFLDSQGNILIITAIMLAVNLMTIFLPVKKNQAVVHITHLIANFLFTFFFSIDVLCRQEDFGYLLFFLLSAVLIQGLVFCRLMQQKNGNAHTYVGGACYIATTALLLLMFAVLTNGDFRQKILVYAAEGVFLLVCAFLFLLFGKSRLKWIQYWIFSATMLFISFYSHNNVWHTDSNLYWKKTAVTLGIFFTAKLLSRIKILRISELAITAFTALQALYFFCEPDLTIAICFIGAFLISLLALNHWKAVYEGIVIFLLETFVLINFQNELTPTVMVCILFMGVLGFNSFTFFRDNNIRIFNYISLGCMGFLYLAAAFWKNHLSYGILLVVGIAFMVLACREEFGMNFRIKNMIFVMFLCYMILIWDIPLPLLQSILLIAVAIGAVAAGFIMKERKLRVTGLVLTLIVCGKIVLYDFAGTATAEKIVLFLTVGLSVLAISGIYIALEKKIV